MADDVRSEGSWQRLIGRRPWLLFAAYGILQTAMPPVLADGLDPTLPPAGFAEQVKAGGPPQAMPLQVSSVFLMGKKSYAIVSGQMLRLGDKLDAASETGRVCRIDEAGVWLKTARGLRQLKLLPQVAKTPAGKMEHR